MFRRRIDVKERVSEEKQSETGQCGIGEPKEANISRIEVIDDAIVAEVKTTMI